MRVLLIEDDNETARYIADGLQQHDYVVTRCSDGPTGMLAAQSHTWDLIILDRMLPNEFDGLSVLQAIRQGGNVTPVLVLSALISLDERVHGLRSGGDDYLTKPFAFQELLARCEALLRRAGMHDLQELRVGDLKLDLRLHLAERAGQPITLQPREFRLLEFLMRHQGQVVTRSMLLEAVWGYHFEPQTNVVDVQIKRLRDKIDREFDPPLLHTERGAGYMIRQP